MSASQGGATSAAPSSTVAQSFQVAIIGENAAGIITGWNSGAEFLYGYSADDVVGRSRDILVAEESRAGESEVLSRLWSGEPSPPNSHSRRRRRDGTVFEASVTWAPVLDADGALAGVTTASWNSGEIAHAEARFEGVLEAAPDGMLGVAPDGTIAFVNVRVEQMFGYTREELAGQSVGMLVPIRNVLAHQALEEGFFRRAQSEPPSRLTQLDVRRKNGTTFPAEVTIGPVADDTGLAMIATIRDATLRVATLQALQESETRLRELAENVNVGFILRSLDPPEFLYVSPGYEQIYGYDPMIEAREPEANLGVIHPDDQEFVRSDYWAKAGAGLPAQAEFRVLRPDGGVRWIRTTSHPVLDADGLVRRVAATAEDISERKMAEEAANAARAEAEKANAAKNEFLSRMSHELRTPLNAVLGFAQLLELDDLNAEQSDGVQHILRGGRHLLGLIDDVLDIAKIESDRLDMSIEPIPVPELLAETVDLMVPLADILGVTLNYRRQNSDLVHVQGDRRRLRQVLLNLLSNAIKYNSRGGHVVVSCEQTIPGQLDLVVRDTGRGIRSDDLPRLFTPFDRLGAQVTGVEGTGVGLALSQRLMTAMGGSLRARSEVDVGSVFTASLPLSEPAATGVPAISVDSPTIFRATAEDRPTSTLLYIDDNSSNVQLMEGLLHHRLHWQMIVAGRGALGLELATTVSPDLLLLDLHLPDVNGIEVLHRLRADPQTSRLPVVVVSADANPNQIRRLLAAGAHSYLTKPLSVSKVLELLDASERSE